MGFLAVAVAATSLVALPVSPPAQDPSVQAKPAPDLRVRIPRMLVLDFVAQGDAGKDLARTLTDVAVKEVVRAGGFAVLSQSDVLAQLGVERQRVFMGCTADRSCLAEIAGAVDADRTLSGTVTKLGDGYFVSATMVDARKISTLGGAEETLRSAKPEELVDAVRRVVYRTLTGRHRDAQAIIEFDVLDVQARVVLDGVELGRGPFQDNRRVSEGRHHVVIAKEGYATWDNEFPLEAGGRAHIAPHLVPVGGARKAMGWTSVSLGAAAVVLGGASLWQESEARKHYSDARGMLGPGGILPASASAQSYRNAVSAGDSSHRTAVATGVGAGVAIGTSLILGYLSYRQTGEVGPFRF